MISTGKLTLSNTSRNHQATYACVVTNAIGSAYSTVSINVEWPPDFVDSEYENNGHTKDEILNEDNNKNKVESEAKNNNHNDVEEKNKDENDNQREDSDQNDPPTDINNTNTIDDKKNKSDGLSNYFETTGGTIPSSQKNDDNNDQKDSDDKTDSDIRIVKETEVEKIFGKNGIKTVEVVKGDDAYLNCQTDAKPQARVSQFRSKIHTFIELAISLFLLSVYI